MNRREGIQRAVDRLKIGECLQIDRHAFEEAFPCGYPSIYRTSLEAFLSSQVGSMWGCIRATVNPMNGNVTVSRHGESDKIFYVDPDREHFFTKDAHGFYHLRAQGA